MWSLCPAFPLTQIQTDGRSSADGGGGVLLRPILRAWLKVHSSVSAISDSCVFEFLRRRMDVKHLNSFLALSPLTFSGSGCRQNFIPRAYNTASYAGYFQSETASAVFIFFRHSMDRTLDLSGYKSSHDVT